MQALNLRTTTRSGLSSSLRKINPFLSANLFLRSISTPAFANIKQLPPDPLFGISARSKADKRSPKVDLVLGAYRDNEGKPWILPSVKVAEELVKADPSYNHEYLAIDGFKTLTVAASKVALGAESSVFSENRIVSSQTLSGTGALHLAGVFLSKFYTGNISSVNADTTISSENRSKFYVSKPTWANHIQIFDSQGFDVKTYRYWNDASKTLDFEGYLEDINNAPSGSIFLLHSCAHNPTGLDPTPEQWIEILNTIKSKKHLAIFDTAYQGFASGDLTKDAWALRKGVEILDTPIVICQSFAKNTGMYGERVGALHVVLPETNEPLLSAIASQLKKITRSELSNPPAYGAKIVAQILSSPELSEQWNKDLVTMSGRINKMRALLRENLEKLNTPGTWNHITDQIGMFSFTGLKKEHVERLAEKHAIYLVGSGRISVAGLNENNVEYVAKAIDETIRHFESK
ncbi:aspartate aminotransferase [Ascoidea rubescens DSM 1968]|uniref:Aspartate aminotransferase n=1 Tax=Ascoidea rubescens DSM 1968 TaxID=1344418 RepID=A0A1D2VI43_9ASCO|nr:aspartate aminotransferase [Ascoidea rubescens DSM 1968]ODV61153.1 aspartate aminotransferase [Ascoidea rubescens DSM 1968]